MASLDPVEEKAGFLVAQSEVDLVRKIVGALWQPRVPGNSPWFRSVFGIIADLAPLATLGYLFGSALVDETDLAVVLILGQVRDSDTLRTEARPVNRARESLELSTGSTAEDASLALVGVPHRVDEVSLGCVRSPGEITR